MDKKKYFKNKILKLKISIIKKYLDHYKEKNRNNLNLSQFLLLNPSKKGKMNLISYFLQTLMKKM